MRTSRSAGRPLSNLARLARAAVASTLIGGLLVAGPAPAPAAAAAPQVTVRDLSVNHRQDTLGVPVAAPVFSWHLSGTSRGIVQSSRQIQVATAADRFDAPDVWDSGRVASRESVNVRYTGPDLRARTRYFWRVRVWDGTGAASDWSRPAWFETALPADDTTAADWHAEWVGGPPNEPLGMDWSDYTLTVRTSDIKDALGIVFYADSAAGRNTYMWQLSTRGGMSVRPHSRVNGSWTELGATWIPDELLPGGFAAEHTVSIALSGGQATTSIDGHFIESRPIPLRSGGTAGFRTGAGESGVVHEVTVTKGDQTLFHTDFADKVNPFAIGTLTENGLSVSGTEALGVFAIPSLPLPLLHRDFRLDKPVAAARLYSTALGVYQVEINGRRVGNEELAPGWTDYSKQLQYQVHDVTELLRQGGNAIGAIVAPGWYAGNIAWFGPRQWGSSTAFLGRLDVTYADGTTDTLATDGSWVWRRGPVLDADLLMGETYDFRREVPGWSEPGTAAGWERVHVYQPAVGDLHPQTDPPVRVTEQRATKAVSTPAPGVTIYDMGQNMVGWVRVRLTGKAGDVVRIRHGEVLNKDGTLYTANLRTAKATETVTLGHDGTTEFSPSFTFHGFRYVEITGLATPPAASDVVGVVIGTDNPRISSFDTSNPLLNQLQSNVVWGIRGNFLSVPTDTPARDERLGYSGDLNVIANTATFNVDAYAFLSKWLRDMRVRQSPNGIFSQFSPGIGPGLGESVATAGWGDGAVNAAYTLWKQYGDTQVIDDNWSAMVRHVAYWTSVAKEGVVPDGHGIGDWLNLDDPTPNSLLATAYYAQDARQLAEMARATGRDAEADQYEALARDVRSAYAAEFIKPDGTVSTGSQTAYAMSLGMDLVPADLRAAVGRKLVAAVEARGWHLSTGFLGTPHLLPALSATGHDDVAYRLLNQQQYPSWLYEVTMGATTTWERWDSIRPDGSFQDPAMNSFNHYAYGAVGQWMYASIGGITPTSAGYATFDVAPRPGGGLTHADISHVSPYGAIRSAWQLNDAGEMTLDVTVPENTTATVRVPAVSPHAVTESGASADQAQGVRYLKMADGTAVYTVGSGSYHFRVDNIRGYLGVADDEATSFHDQMIKLVRSGAVRQPADGELVAEAVELLTTTGRARTHYLAGRGRPAMEAAASAQARAARLVTLLGRDVDTGAVSRKDSEPLVATLRRVAAALSAASRQFHGAAASLSVPSSAVVAGSTTRLEAVLDNGGDQILHDPSLVLALPEGWSATPVDGSPDVVPAGGSATLRVDVAVPADQAPVRGLELNGVLRYRRGESTVDVPVQAVVDVLSPVEIVRVEADPRILDAPGDASTVTVTLRNLRPAAPVEGAVRFSVPDGWSVDAPTKSYRLDAAGQGTVTAKVTSPRDQTAPAADVDVTVTYGELTGDTGAVRITSALRSWLFDTDGDPEGWQPTNQLTPFVVADGFLTSSSTGGDPYMVYTGPLSYDVSQGASIEITMVSSTASDAQIFWGRQDEPYFSESKSTKFSVKAGGPYTYTVPIPPQSTRLTMLRVDPLTVAGDIRIDSIRIVR